MKFQSFLSSNFLLFLIFLFALWWSFPRPVLAMHIMEGFLPPVFCFFWYVVYIPFFFLGLWAIKKQFSENPSYRVILGFVTAFAFVLSALKLPSVTGSSSHPTGVGLGAILFGPFPMAVVGCIVLFFQALLLAHGGITTLGANSFSMGVVGPIVSYALYRLSIFVGIPFGLAVFIAASLGDLATYIVTSFQLAWAFPASQGGILGSFMRFFGIFAITQVPLAIAEGLLTVMVLQILQERIGSSWDKTISGGIYRV
ncbi:MAG: energy-coupling factor ABC transporter permease [Candidatus Caldatribacteriaceae bacterium]